MSRVPPELINYENQMDDFLAESRRKNESESEADRKFIESLDKIRAANKALPKKRFSWAGLIALLAVALFVGWMVYQAVEAF